MVQLQRKCKKTLWSDSSLDIFVLSYKNQPCIALSLMVRVCKTPCRGHVTCGVSVRRAMLLLEQFVSFVGTSTDLRSGIYVNVKISAMLKNIVFISVCVD